eukprot:Rhum_TRINITY_DN23962_c0_g1::Rhum_TRINITY_DN23962_c0_g1_i1::g.179033::m.179033
MTRKDNKTRKGRKSSSRRHSASLSGTFRPLRGSCETAAQDSLSINPQHAACFLQAGATRLSLQSPAAEWPKTPGARATRVSAQPADIELSDVLRKAISAYKDAPKPDAMSDPIGPLDGVSP